MIYGIGIDIAKVSRFEKWVQSGDIIERFFNTEERLPEKAGLKRKTEFYAARFAAKEAFSKAIGKGISGFSLSEVFISSEESGKPVLNVIGEARRLLNENCGNNWILHVSLSHETEYAIAFVIIEIKDQEV